MNRDIAAPFRFIKQRISGRHDLAPMDALYMLERAIEEVQHQRDADALDRRCARLIAPADASR